MSFDDGDHWQSLRLNMPATSIRDLVIKDDDLVVGTHGRGFWILDDITPLRQLQRRALNAAARTCSSRRRRYRIRWNTNTDTPLPPDEPAGQNPPDGAIIDYYLQGAATGVITLEILDAAGALVRRYASDDQPANCRDEGNVPAYWIRPLAASLRQRGTAPFVWDLHYPPPPGLPRGYPIAATPHDTAPEPTAPWVPARNLHRSADGERQDVYAAADRDDGSARQERRPLPCSSSLRCRSGCSTRS